MVSYFVADGTWLNSHGDVARRFAGVIHRIHADLQANPAAYRAALVGHQGLEQVTADCMALPRLETDVSLSQVQTWADIFPQPPGQPATLSLVPSDLLFDSAR